jgi:hypothetical protein
MAADFGTLVARTSVEFSENIDISSLNRYIVKKEAS